MTKTTTAKFMKQATKLAGLLQEYASLTAHDLAKNPFTVREGENGLVIRRKGEGSKFFLVKRDGVVWSHDDGKPYREWTIGHMIRVYQGRIQDLRESGGAEWFERVRLNRMVRKHVESFSLQLDWPFLAELKRMGVRWRWNKAETAADRKEQRELKQRLAQVR